jgi:hypothetical protein
MSVWILTTGNSDVHLKHERNWNSLFTSISDGLECQEFASATLINPKDKREGFTVPPRVLGLTYENQPDYYDELKFPLIDTFCKRFTKGNIKLEKIIILLTDQSNLFPEDGPRLNEKCPYWQDTISLKPLLIKYFDKKLKIQPEFIELKPKSKKGLEHWNATLELVKKEFEQIDINPLKTVYVSHQAGTPAISSAVQFASLGKFKKVEFLLSNQYYDDDYNLQAEAEIVDSSEYWRGIQIQKAKQLITSGFPGAALKVLDGVNIPDNTILNELSKQVDFFNLYSRGTDTSQDLNIPEAVQRVINTLDLIGVFFSNQNYLQGITLLAAAQETFMKAAILSHVARINATINIDGTDCGVSELITWKPLGLFLSDDLRNKSNDIKKQVLQKLKFPECTLDNEPISLVKNDDFKVTNRNFALVAWLKKLEPNFKLWSLLEWSCKKYRNSDDDLRNQLMHNLRGMETLEVIEYLCGGDTKGYTGNDVVEVYKKRVKQPFFTAIELFQLPFKREKVYKILQEIADGLV